MESFNWTCTHCQRDVTITNTRYSESTHTLGIENAEGQCSLISIFVVCPNPECKKYSLSLSLNKSSWYNGRAIIGGKLHSWNLIPPSNAKSFPSYVPQQILNDYEEACLIRDQSPKASATLSRRCLQGIIRDFWSVKGRTLKEEIEKIKDKVDPLTWQAIDAVRQIGNIGAHMELNVDLIVDVEPEEAELLITLIETLIKDWYISKEEKKKHLEALVSVATKKKEGKTKLKDGSNKE